MQIRTGRQEDAADLLEIMNYEITHNTATFDLREKSPEEWQQWMERHGRDNHPLLVAEEDGRAVGYACLSPYREKEAYYTTVELSIYVHPAYRRRGIARALMEAILAAARHDPITHTVVSVISGENTASIRLHEQMGFRYSGTLHAVGQKFGRWLDIVNYEWSAK